MHNTALYDKRINTTKTQVVVWQRAWLVLWSLTKILVSEVKQSNKTEWHLYDKTSNELCCRRFGVLVVCCITKLLQRTVHHVILIR